MAPPSPLRHRDLLHALVLDRRTTEDFGRVEVVWMYPQAHRVLGFICKSSRLTERLSPKRYAFNLPQIHSLSPKTVWVNSPPTPTDTSRVQQLETLLGHEVWTEAGATLGKIVDCQFDGQTGQILAYQVSLKGLPGILAEQVPLKPAEILSFGSKRVLVTPQAGDRLQEQTQEHIQEQIHNLGQQVKDQVGSPVGQQVGQTLGGLKQEYRQVKQELKQELKVWSQQAQTLWQKTSQKTGATVETMGGQVASTVAHTVTHTVETMAPKVETTVAKAQTMAQTMAHTVGQTVTQAVSQVVNQTVAQVEKLGENWEIDRPGSPYARQGGHWEGLDDWEDAPDEWDELNQEELRRHPTPPPPNSSDPWDELGEDGFDRPTPSPPPGHPPQGKDPATHAPKPDLSQPDPLGPDPLGSDPLPVSPPVESRDTPTLSPGEEFADPWDDLAPLAPPLNSQQDPLWDSPLDPVLDPLLDPLDDLEDFDPGELDDRPPFPPAAPKQPPPPGPIPGEVWDDWEVPPQA